MYFSDEDYELITNEIIDRNIYIDGGCDNCNIAAKIIAGPAYAYYLFREAFPILNDEYDMKYDAHVVYYAFYHYKELDFIRRGLGKISEIKHEPDGLVKQLHELKKIYTGERIRKMKCQFV